uniref:DUF4939 domain-containing protein n=1 Tax=Oryzias latipes TaxID=8090 RepID=A0A3B3IIP9_ORYLA
SAWIILSATQNAISRVTTVQEDLISRIKGINTTLMELAGQKATPASPLPNFRLQPEPYFGDVKAFGGFLLQCHLLFLQAPRYYNSDLSKITLIINSLRNKALQWAQAFLAVNPVTHLTYEHFIEELKLVFDQPRKKNGVGVGGCGDRQ